jgi:hypothetical protein
MPVLNSADDLLKEIWNRKGYYPAPIQEIQGFFYTPEEYQQNPALLATFEGYISELKNAGYIAISSHEYTNPDGTPMRMVVITQSGIDHVNELEA